MSLDSSQELRVDTNEADCMNVGGSLAHDFARLAVSCPIGIYRRCTGTVDYSQFHMVR